MGIFELFGFVTNDLSQALHVADSHDADVVVEAEGLDEGEVNLECDITLELLVGSKDAESHAVRVAAKVEEKYG